MNSNVVTNLFISLVYEKISRSPNYFLFCKVDRHPQFRHSRCLFVVRTDGGWIDFSYQKCLRAYIRDKYPTHAERFIREHFKRGSGWCVLKQKPTFELSYSFGIGRDVCHTNILNICIWAENFLLVFVSNMHPRS